MKSCEQSLSFAKIILLRLKSLTHHVNEHPIPPFRTHDGKREAHHRENQVAEVVERQEPEWEKD